MKTDKRDSRIVRGLQLSWTDQNPLIDNTDISNKNVSHKSPVWRLIAMQIWEKSAPRILATVYKWHITVTVVFRSNRYGKDLHHIGEFTANYAHNKGSEAMNDAIERFIFDVKLNNALIGEQKGTDYKSYGEYVRTDFLAEIVG